MKYARHYVLYKLCVSSLLVVSSLSFAFRGYKTLVVPRSQGCNSVRETAGWQKNIYTSDLDYNYWSFSITPGYGQAFNNKKITQMLIGSDTVIFSGSRYSQRDKHDILADYFGLPSDFKSVVTVDPHISNFCLDFNFFWGLNELKDGLFMQLYMPLVHSKWDLNFCEAVQNAGTAFYPAGYMSPERIAHEKLPADIATVLQGATEFGDMKEALQYGTLFGFRRDSHIADFRVSLGYNFLKDNYHVGLAAMVAAPTGTRSSAKYLFEPHVGNGKHWELGFGLSGHRDFGNNRCWALHLDAHVMHLFGSHQKRSYDLIGNCPGSRYMLLAEVLPPSRTLFYDVPGRPAAPNQYTGRLFPAINKTTLDSTIKINAQADIACKLVYQPNDAVSVEFGYNLWARSPEKLVCRQEFPADRYVLKGDAQLYGFTAANAAVQLNPSQHSATLTGGQGVTNFATGSQFANANSDNAAVALTTGSAALNQLNATDAGDLSIAQAPVSTSHDPIFLNDCSIDNNSALAAKGLSHTLFGHCNWLCKGEQFSPYLGFGGEVELAPCDVKNNSALSQWGIWVKGGIKY